MQSALTLPCAGVSPCRFPAETLLTPALLGDVFMKIELMTDSRRPSFAERIPAVAQAAWCFQR
jgi:hypothetical protein